MEPLHAVLDRFKLDELNKNWVDKVWDSGFTNVDNVPDDDLMFLESYDMQDLLSETCSVVKGWMTRKGQKIAANPKTDQNSSSPSKQDEVSWQTLITLNLDVRALLAVLTLLMKKGQAFDASQDSRKSCLRATSLYFVLLTVPGSNAFQAFHPSIYEIALQTLSLSRHLLPPTKKSSKQRHCEEEDSQDSDGNEEEQAESTLSRQQSAALTRNLNSVLYDLVVLLASASLSLEMHSMELTIYNLVELTKLTDELVKNSQESEASVNSLAHNAYVALGALCNPKYATIELITLIIGKYVLPQFLIGSAQLAPKQLSIVRERTIHFFKTLLQQHGDSAQPALTTLIQHLMIKCPERLEGRQKQAALVIKLMNLSAASNEAFARSLKDLVQLSDHKKISCRIFAQEIIGKFLLELASTQSQAPEVAHLIWTAKRTKSLLLASALSRCVDVSSMVRGRAIATFAEYTDSTEDPEVRDIFQSERRRKNNAQEMPSRAELEEAIERIGKSSEAGNEDAEFELPEVEGITKMLRSRGEDERALVRKGALQVLRNGVLICEDLLEEATRMIKSHCRDSTLTVRRFAIRVLTTLLERFPENLNLSGDWVNFVVPQVFDAEAKVQEEVMDSLEKLTIGKITNNRNIAENTTTTTTATDLPWRILKEIAANKMTEHLARACKIWIDNGTITQLKINHIKSHIGTKNDLEAWLVLASISENKILPGMENFYEYYERGWKNSADNSDKFLASLCLQVLRHCWSSFDDDSLRKIQDELSKHLNDYEVRVVLISHCLDILYAITKHLATGEEEEEEEEKKAMRDLMKISESSISRIMETCEESETCPRNSVNLLLRAISTLGHASFLCCEKISTTTLRTLQGFLLERKSLPEVIKSKKELQGAAIMVLGQQALRDRDIAQEMTPIFGRLLRNTGSGDENMASGPAVRINAAKALADICVRFTTLVQPYLPDMCVSMKDSNIDVRQVILVIFIQLLVQDFIKINGAFFFHILTMLADSDATIRQMTMFLIKERLMTKNKSLINRQLVQSIFHFNDYERRSNVLESAASRRKARERRALTISGAENSEKRKMIYDFMLEHLDPPGKLAVLVKLTRQIFSRANSTRVEGLDFDSEKGSCVFRDAVFIVSSDFLQPGLCGRQTNEDENFEELTVAVATPANSVVIEAMKKHRLEILLPRLVELKRRFSKKKSPLLGDVTRLIAKIIGDYSKEQLADFHNEYPNFEAEMERDLRKSEKNSQCIDIEAGKTSTPTKKPITAIDRNSLLIDPNRKPYIVLRRLSTLTYPGISGWQTKVTPDSSPETVATETRRSSRRSERKKRKSEEES